MRLRDALLVIVAVTLLGIAPVAVFAQLVSGNLTGTVYDATGGVVGGVTITAHNDSTGLDATTTTTSMGEYHFYNLPVGNYTVTASAKGFTETQLKNVPVAL